MLKIEEDWGDAGGVDDRFCYLGVSPDLPRKSRLSGDLPPSLIVLPLKSTRPAPWSFGDWWHQRDTSLHGQRIHMSSVTISPPSGRYTCKDLLFWGDGQWTFPCQIYIWPKISSLSAIQQFWVSSFWFQTFESMVAVLSPNLRLWETFDRIYCQVLHINCPSHQLPCHSLQSTNITCESWNKKPIHPHLPRHLILTDKWIWKTMRGKHCCDF